MSADRELRIDAGISLKEKCLWHVGWDPRLGYFVTLALAGVGWLVVQNPVGLSLGLFGLWMQFTAVRLVNSQCIARQAQAESIVKSDGFRTLNFKSDEVRSFTLTVGSGRSPFGVKISPTLSITSVFLSDTFFAVCSDAQLSLADLRLRLAKNHDEFYYRHVSAVDYQPPLVQIRFSNGQTKQFSAGGNQCDSMLGELRTSLRGLPSMMQPDQPSVPAGVPSEAVSTKLGSSTGADSRYCYLRVSRLLQLFEDPTVLDALIDRLEVPGKVSVHRQLTPPEKQAAIEAQVDHFRRTPTSIWYGVAKREILAASIWLSHDSDLQNITKKLISEIFCGVAREEDLLRPVAKWLKGKGFEPYMEVPLGRRRIDVLGVKKPTFGSEKLLAIELKNDDAQFSRAVDQMGTYSEYANSVYLACTPAFAAEYLERNAYSRGVKQWDSSVLERKLSSGGYGLLIVERDTVFEVISPKEGIPSSDRINGVLRSLSSVMRVEL